MQRTELASLYKATPADGTKVTVYGRYQEWYTVGYNGKLGYAYADFIV